MWLYSVPEQHSSSNVTCEMSEVVASSRDLAAIDYAQHWLQGGPRDASPATFILSVCDGGPVNRRYEVEVGPAPRSPLFLDASKYYSVK